VYYRRRRGESPGADDYAASDPGDAVAVRAALAEVTTDLPRCEPPATDPDRTTPEAPRPASGEPPYPTVPGYEIRGRLGRGGMGEVVRGHDLHMGRDLAVKVLREEHKGEPRLVQRFLAEGRIHGRLQHPGIVPVHELGELPDRRPYFTMKLVEGRTLADLLKERSDPAQDRPHFLTIFQQVCQAVAYAHKNGVIHRDLKPGNVMVGAFGEVQVMDWGLAKALGRGGPAPEPEGGAGVDGRDASDGDSGLATQPGSVLGTYAYMAPEQARGEVGRLDERADVFGLGAVLCQILTGRPPFSGAGRDELARRAQACDHAAALAALDACGADAELVRLAKGCLAAEAAARTADAAVVAAAMTSYLAGVQERLRRAELERAAAEARAKEEQRRRRAQLGLAAAVLALLAAGAGGGLWMREQAAARRQLVASTLDRVKELRDQLRFREAAAVLEQGQAALGERGPDDLRRQLDLAERELALVRRLDGIRQRRATLVEGDFDYRTAARDYAAAFSEAGLGEVGDAEEVVAKRVRASGVSGSLVAALDDWASAERSAAVVEKAESQSLAWLLGVARRADPDEWRDRLRDLAVWRDPRALRALAEEALRDGGAKLGELSPQVLGALGVLLGGAEAVPLLRAAQRRYPNDFWLSFDLGNALRQAKQDEEALGYYRVAVALRPDAPVAHNNLGAALRDHKDVDGAIAECRTAIALDPKYAPAHTNLGNALHDKGDLDGAIAEYRTAIELDPKFAPAHSNLGAALYEQKDLEGAIAEHRQAIALDPKYATAHNNLGNALRAKKDLGGAIAAYQKAIALDPEHTSTHFNLGLALYEQKDLEGAIAAYRRAVALDPKHAKAHYNLGNALYDRKDLEGAIAAYQKAIALDPKDAGAHNNLGNALHGQKDVDGAIAAYRKAIALDPKLAKAHNNLGSALRDKKDLSGATAEYRQAIALDPKYASAHCNLGLALYEQKDLEGAIAAYQKAIDSDPKHAGAYNNLGNALYDRKDLEGAIAAYQKAIALDPKDAAAHYNLGNTLREQKDLDGAIAAFQRAIALDPKHAKAHNNLGDALRDKKDLGGAIAAFQRAVALDPKFALAHIGLGNALYDRKDLEGAIAAYQRAVALDPKDAKAHGSLGLALRDRGDLDGAIAEHQKAIALDPKLATAHYNLGNTLRAKKDLGGAIAAYRQAVALDPEYALAHFNLGLTLYEQKDLEGAIAAYQGAIKVSPDFPEAHVNLGAALRDQGRFTEAVDELRRGHALGSQRPGWRHPSADWVRRAEQLVELDRKLLAVLAGQAEPADATERLALAQLCRRYKRLHAAAARFYAGAFAADPRQQPRYDAACSAVLAAAGQGEDAKHLPDKVRQMLRRQALAWLRDDLVLWAKMAERAEAPAKQQVRQAMQHWQQDADLASVRDPAALGQLPDDERQPWRQLWADVAALLAKVGAAP
jgi:tetratricopeptide (TPR) repeat protein